MYLSRLILNPRCRRVQAELAHPYEMHRSLMQAFPDRILPSEERVLFRVDHTRSRPPCLLVQSLTRPDWSCVQGLSAPGYLLSAGKVNPAVKTFDPGLDEGQVLAFRLRANPTVKRRGKRLGLYREEDQLDWLSRKASRGGFQIVHVRCRQEQAVGGVIHREESTTDHLKLAAVTFDGVLRVTDPDLLVETVRRGIGSGKGLGFGLLSLARPV